MVKNTLLSGILGLHLATLKKISKSNNYFKSYYLLLKVIMNNRRNIVNNVTARQ